MFLRNCVPKNNKLNFELKRQDKIPDDYECSPEYLTVDFSEPSVDERPDSTTTTRRKTSGREREQRPSLITLIMKSIFLRSILIERRYS